MQYTDMSTPAKSTPSLRHRPNLNVEDQTDGMRKKPISSSLDSIRISPRVPPMTRNSRKTSDPDERDQVQLALLSQDHDEEPSFDNVHEKTRPLSAKDKRAMSLLIVLCPSTPFLDLSVAHPPSDFIQGIPVSHARLWSTPP